MVQMFESPLSGRGEAAVVLAELMPMEGAKPAHVPGVTLWRVDQAIPRVPVLYEPCLVFVLQGSKRGFLNNRSFLYGPGTYLVLTAPLSFECETTASPEAPLLCLYLRLQGRLIAELLAEMSLEHSPASRPAQTVQSIPMDSEMTGSVYRLVRALRKPDDARVLGPQMVREIVYRALQGPGGSALRSMVGLDRHFAQICRVMQHLHHEYDRKITVRELAMRSGMSPSVFHQHFKQVMSTTPGQYVKSIRLHKARSLMIDQGLGVAEAALRVGCRSPSQFSREFKRLFGYPPTSRFARHPSMPLLD
ncbi:MAG: AraC family transcriptional regulator [Acidobacteriota bacterium]